MPLDSFISCVPSATRLMVSRTILSIASSWATASTLVATAMSGVMTSTFSRPGDPEDMPFLSLGWEAGAADEVMGSREGGLLWLELGPCAITAVETRSVRWLASGSQMRHFPSCTKPSIVKGILVRTVASVPLFLKMKHCVGSSALEQVGQSPCSKRSWVRLATLLLSLWSLPWVCAWLRLGPSTFSISSLSLGECPGRWPVGTLVLSSRTSLIPGTATAPGRCSPPIDKGAELDVGFAFIPEPLPGPESPPLFSKGAELEGI
mmetsp:Transcript_40066/g.74022  ORF Transcript_40066/g.74022 Transcript_40066/m.74022 type:complete len:263 (-) Transcript_40066:2960-3748(-)